ncbi:hypothetical protein HYH03_003427 [Edaphochlamys debaryana]|uniref:Protein N-terminal glutamine amidohydrolase n=1 Tax=Edaphochlamys debaryana TaxID=47281 RepID=A0A835YCD6_9CHLO|nr:hypothetical protein HYH03_003427 [Edaphochlamys debaryana]|eukprot:KAG2498683.1 hypothetical protein HYH03_003427 [Edaphochlamys debaryana]
MLARRLVELGHAPSLGDLFAVFVSNPNKQVPLWQQRAGLRGHDSNDGSQDEDSDDSGGTGDDESEGSDEDHAAGAGVCYGERGLVVWDYHVLLVQRLPYTGAAENRLPAVLRAGPSGSAGPGAPAAGAAAAVEAAQAAAEAAAGPSRAVVWDLDTLLPFPCSLDLYAQNALRAHMTLLPHLQRLYRVVPAATYLRSFASDRSHMRRPGGGWASPPPAYPPIVAADGATNNIHVFWHMTKDMCAVPGAAVHGGRGAAAEEGEQEGEGAGAGGTGEEGVGEAGPRGRGGASTEAAEGAGNDGARKGEGSSGGGDSQCGGRGQGAGSWLREASAAAGPYGLVLDEPGLLRAFGLG